MIMTTIMKSLPFAKASLAPLPALLIKSLLGYLPACLLICLRVCLVAYFSPAYMPACLPTFLLTGLLGCQPVFLLTTLLCLLTGSYASLPACLQFGASKERPPRAKSRNFINGLNAAASRVRERFCCLSREF